MGATRSRVPLRRGRPEQAELLGEHKQLGGPDFESSGEPKDRRQGRGDLGALELADVVAVQARRRPQGFLRELALAAEAPDSFPERLAAIPLLSRVLHPTSLTGNAALPLPAFLCHVAAIPSCKKRSH